MLKSLQHRILFLASLTLLLFSGLTGFVLQQAFHYSLEEEAKARLQAHIYTLLAAADIGDHDDHTLQLPAYLQEDRFNQIQSDLYGVVTNSEGEVIWRSYSAVNMNADFPRTLDQGVRHFQHSEIDRSEPLLVFSMGVIWELPRGGERTFTFTIMESKRAYLAKLEGFKKKIRHGLWGGSLFMILVQFMILRWGLAPLKKIANGIREIEAGRSESLQGDYPKELALISGNINRLVDNERRQRERYRNTMGDLAHSLKTPLAVLRNGVTQLTSLNDLKQLSADQLGRMEQIVKHQLQRAVIMPPASVLQGCEVEGSVQRILSALKKVYYDKPVAQSVDIDAELLFFGEEADLMEVLGNLLDNAHKHCKTSVTVRAVWVGCEGKMREEKRGKRGPLFGWALHIEDDGEGVPVDRRQQILQRGVRSDSRGGQGIGLAVATEIVEGYGGTIEVNNAECGGACFTLYLPMRKGGASGGQSR